MHKFQDVWKSEFSCLIDDSNNDITCMYCYVCRKAGKTELSQEKKCKRESLVYHNKTKSLRHENCFNVVSEKAHCFSLIQGINNYVQINTYLRYVV